MPRLFPTPRAPASSRVSLPRAKSSWSYLFPRVPYTIASFEPRPAHEAAHKIPRGCAESLLPRRAPIPPAFIPSMDSIGGTTYKAHRWSREAKMRPAPPRARGAGPHIGSYDRKNRVSQMGCLGLRITCLTIPPPPQTVPVLAGTLGCPYRDSSRPNIRACSPRRSTVDVPPFVRVYASMC